MAIIRIFQLWRREPRRDIRHRQLRPAGWAAAFLMLGPLATFLRAATPSTAEQELRAAKVLEIGVLARGAPLDEKNTLRRLYAELERKYPNDLAIKNGRAEFLWNIDDREEAAREWRAAAQLDPANAVVLNHLGGAYLAAGEVREAFHCFTRATAADPANPLYHFNLANVVFLFRHELAQTEEKAFDLATLQFAEASKLAPADAEYARAYAEVFYSVPKPDWNVALQAWERFHQLTANKDFALLNLARIHMKLGQKDEARSCLAQIKGDQFTKLKTRLGQRIDTE